MSRSTKRKKGAEKRNLQLLGMIIRNLNLFGSFRGGGREERKTTLMREEGRLRLGGSQGGERTQCRYACRRKETTV